MSIGNILLKVDDIHVEVKELTRNKSNNILVHGLEAQPEETKDDLVKMISDLVRTKLCIGRDMLIESLYRVESTSVDVGGWPPVVICFEQTFDRETVLTKAQTLERGGIMVTSEYFFYILSSFLCPGDGGHEQSREGSVGTSEKLHEQDKDKVSSSSVFPTNHQTICG